MQDQPTSEFQELREEARATVKQKAYDKNSRRWMRAIYGLIALNFVIVYLFSIYIEEMPSVNTWLTALFVWVFGFIACGLLSLILSFIPFPENWKWRWRISRLFQFLNFVYLLLLPFILFYLLYFFLPNLG